MLHCYFLENPDAPCNSFITARVLRNRRGAQGSPGPGAEGTV